MTRSSRRAFLRGTGSVAIALPLGIAALSGRSWAKAPPRFVSLFYGNGMPRAFVEAGYDHLVLEPLKPLSAKMTMVRGLSLPESGGADLHYKGTARFGKGVSAQGESSAGGESLDNALYRRFGAGTKLLNVNLHTHNTGGNPATRWYHSWRGARQPNDELSNPMDVFNTLFGSLTPGNGSGVSGAPAPSPEEKRKLRYRQSVLDSVLEHYQALSGPSSPYGATGRRILDDHLQLVRDLERKAVDLSSGSPPPVLKSCEQAPQPPPDIKPAQACSSSLCPSDSSSYYAGPGANWNEVWELNSQLYAMALRCGIARFGTMGCTGGGDRYPIPELRPLGVGESPHILAHDWSPGRENGFDKCVRWLMDKLGYFLRQLDDPAWKDPDGGTVLDNTLVMIGTELGTGKGSQHYVDYMTFLLAGARGAFKTGIHEGGGHSDTDLYSTIARVMGLGDLFGDKADFKGHLDNIVE